jgi:hypothetical protein
MIVANGVTNSQKGNMFGVSGDGNYGGSDSTAMVDGVYGTSAIDSTVDQTLLITVDPSDAVCAITKAAIVVEKITDAGSFDVTNVTVFEDFLNYSSLAQAGSGSGNREARFLYSSALVPGSSAAPQFSWDTLLNHPGVVTINNDGQANTIRVFGEDNSNVGGIPLDNDFDIEILARCTYSGGAADNSVTFHLNSDGDSVEFTVNGELAVIQWQLFSTSGTSTIPTSGTWFKARWVYSGGTISLYINGVLIASEAGNFGADNGGWLDVGNLNIAVGETMAASVDYVKLNYQLAR